MTVVVGTKGSNVTKDYSTNVRVSPEESGLPLETAFLGFQVRSLDASRFPDQPAGRLSDEKMLEAENAVRYCLTQISLHFNRQNSIAHVQAIPCPTRFNTCIAPYNSFTDTNGANTRERPYRGVSA